MKDIILPIICKLFNSFLLNGNSPNILKNADITPIAKCNKFDQIYNYRPISVLSSLSTFFEKVIKIKLCDYIDRNDIIS